MTNIDMNKKLLLSLLLLLVSVNSEALSIQFGPDVGINGMKVGASLIQSVKFSPKLAALSPNAPADVHLETDVHAIPGNPQGFQANQWIPNLTITYHIHKVGSSFELIGQYLPMSALGGAHYGVNIKLDGPGKYQISNRYYPPPYSGAYRNTDTQNNIFPWWAVFERHYTFDFFGVGHHGKY